ncbi:hypothetical protein QTP88_019012 [Uroleucon formosanum]
MVTLNRCNRRRRRDSHVARVFIASLVIIRCVFVHGSKNAFCRFGDLRGRETADDVFCYRRLCNGEHIKHTNITSIISDR